MIPKELQDRLWAYVGGIARANEMRALAVGGVEDHMHILLSIPATVSVAKAVQLIKGNASKWIHETFPEHRAFGWQKGYGAFSVSISGQDETIKYIVNQREHHRKRTFQEEFISFLEKHGIAYDKARIWD